MRSIQSSLHQADEGPIDERTVNNRMATHAVAHDVKASSAANGRCHRQNSGVDIRTQELSRMTVESQP